VGFELKGGSIWILGIFLILSVANVVNSTIMLFDTGPESTFTPFLIGDLTGAVPVYAYALISVISMLAFLGGLSYLLVSELSVKDQVEAIEAKTKTLQDNQEMQKITLSEIQNKLDEVDNSLDATDNKLTAELDTIKQNADENGRAIEQTNKKISKQISDQSEALKQSMAEGAQNQQQFMDESLSSLRKQLGEQTELMKANNAQLVDNLNSQMAAVNDALVKIQSKNSKTVTTISKQKGEIDEIRSKLEQLEAKLVAPTSMLNSNSNVEDVKGIGPNRTAELNDIGITNVSDFVMADSKAVAEKLGSSEKTVEKLQGRAQLQMIPGIKEKDLLLLEELDITDRKTLAMQDPIELGKKLNAVFKVNLADGKVLEADKPTIEEIVSWVKYTKN
jgi:predicted nuclease with TOPRIM domain